MKPGRRSGKAQRRGAMARARWACQRERDAWAFAGWDPVQIEAAEIEANNVEPFDVARNFQEK